MNPGAEMQALVERLYPICRSITGDGVRQTLDVLAEHIPLQIREVASHTAVFDWTVPQEWSIRDAFIADSSGRRIVDFAESNLHVVSYSVPVDATMTLDELRPHLHTLPEQPTLTPYRTSYYSPDWGFCLPHELLLEMESRPDEQYHVRIDSTLFDGHLTYAECLLPGRSSDEVLFSVHVCHPSLANDNLAGIAVATWLGRELAAREMHHTVRILFVPGTIGSITWLARNQEHAHKIKHGLVLACAGDPGPLTYKRSRRGDADIDHAVPYVLQAAERPHSVVDFSPYGYDERQYCSPGFNLPVGCLTRTPYAGYPEYHTSADNPSFVSPDAMADTLQACLDVVDVLDRDRRYRSLNPYCEPQLGKRGLYDSLGGRSDAKQAQLAMLWVQNMADGQHTLLDVAQRSGLPFDTVAAAAGALLDAGLIKE